MKKIRQSSEKLMTRDEFRCAVFERDQNKCVICRLVGQDAHHILERRLFDDGGYYLSNGATLCGFCHVLAEQTVLSVETIRQEAGIVAPKIPNHFYPDVQYDKWGNIILANGRRTKGELFEDESVQKILASAGVLDSFYPYTKYPRSMHLPWSPGKTSDDKVIRSLDGFIGQEVVITEKMDGENTSMYSDYFHARSLDSSPHPSQSWARNFHSKIKHDIPKGWRICAENLYAQHSVSYCSLESYLLMFSIWNDSNFCLSWDETLEWSNLIGVPMVPVLYRGLWDESIARGFDVKGDKAKVSEGYVVRVARRFHLNEFPSVLAKYVRENHVQTSHHWKFQAIIPNKLA